MSNYYTYNKKKDFKYNSFKKQTVKNTEVYREKFIYSQV